MAFGTDPTPDGLANPPIDDLMKHADSKYALAIFAAKRARQIELLLHAAQRGPAAEHRPAGRIPEQ